MIELIGIGRVVLEQWNSNNDAATTTIYTKVEEHIDSILPPLSVSSSIFLAM